MDDTRRSIFIIPPFTLVLFFILSGCAAPNRDEIRTFLLQRERPDIFRLAQQLTEAVASQLEESRLLGNEYPILSLIEFEPDLSSPGAQKMRCASTQPLPSKTSDCILLNDHGDFVRVQVVNWESAAFYMYRIYVAPEGLFVEVNPTKDFVALDVFLLEEENLWVGVDQAIRKSAIEIGARPFSP